MKTLAQVTPSNVDKHKRDDEIPVKLCNYTDVYYSDRIQTASEFMKATASQDEIDRFRLRPGDVIVTKDSESWDDIAVPAYVEANLTSAVCGYHLYLVRPGPQVDGRFLAYAFMSEPVAHQFRVEATGITRYGLSTSSLRKGLIPTPPIRAQQALANFLDHKTSRIDKLIDRKKRLLELLEEKRTALITQAVTKGLDPDVPMKDSGVEWLGEIPENWDVMSLKRCTDPEVSICYGILKPGPDIPNGIPYLGAGDVGAGRLTPDELPRTKQEIAEQYPRTKLNSGDLVYAIRGSFGSVAVVPPSLGGANLSRDAARIAPRRDIDAGWLCWSLRSETVQAQFAFHETGTAVTGVNIGDLKEVQIPTPPVQEQVEIRSFLNDQMDVVEHLCRRIDEGIELLSEYRTALISAAVTGKIDVRDEAAA